MRTSLEIDCIIGIIEVHRTKQKQRGKYIDNIKEMVGREKLVVKWTGNRRLTLNCH